MASKDGTAVTGAERNSGSESDRDSDPGVRSVAISVSRDTGTSVQLIIKVPGIRKRHSFFASLLSTFKKPSEPSRLLSNAQFTQWTLTESSLTFTMNVESKKQRKKRKDPNAMSYDRFECRISRFPTRVNPESAEFEVLEPASGQPFILLSLSKLDNLGQSWKDYQHSNGTIDAGSV